ncbi:Hypothetical protein Minf_0586 [Methylacidiphilum infernorum V4]|uniref:Uncharacterized protein n=1 Tax=Methylacidiphilum infernorum (isolate V4) TaxID=481448 RepID=B3DZY3_METI4|nr:Hypothetical protein Minf_0586 [Methylacidiphilum infernorum V4]
MLGIKNKKRKDLAFIGNRSIFFSLFLISFLESNFYPHPR